MAAVSNRNYPFYAGVLSPYIENKKLRYSLYALGVLAVGAASIRYGNTKIAFTLGSAGCFVQGYKIFQIAKEIKNDPDIDSEANTQRISRITNHIFTIGLIWGIVLGGLNLSLIYREGSLLLQGASINSLLQNPKNILLGWFNNAPSLIYHSNNLASIGCFAIPQAIGFTYFSDDIFFGEKKQYFNNIFQLSKNAVNVWIATSEETSLISFFWMIKNMIEALNIPSFFSKLLGEASPQLTAAWKALKNLASLFLLRRLTFKEIHEWITSFSNPTPNPLFKDVKPYSSGWEKAKNTANHLFFYTLNLSLLAARLYYHRYPTAVYLGIGLFYPTNFQTDATIKRTWEIAPDFIGMPLILKCRYLFERLSPMNTALAWWNIPGACLNGLYLAEYVRFSGRRFFSA